MNRISSSLTRASEFLTFVGGSLLFIIVAVTSVNAIGFALDKIARLWGGSVAGIPGYEDIVTLLIAPAAMLFLPYCQLKKGHIFVEFFTSRLSWRTRRAMDRLWTLGMGLLASFLLYWLPFGMLESRSDNAVSRVLGWAEWPFFIPGFFALALWAMISFSQAIGILSSETERNA